MNQALAAIFVVLFQFSTLLAQDAPAKSSPPSAAAKTGATARGQRDAANVDHSVATNLRQRHAAKAGPRRLPAPPDYSQKPTSLSIKAGRCASRTTAAASFRSFGRGRLRQPCGAAIINLRKDGPLPRVTL